MIPSTAASLISPRTTSAWPRGWARSAIGSASRAIARRSTRSAPARYDLRHDYRDDRHLLSLFEFGRGNFSYISLEREWQQTTGFLGKVDVANAGLAPVVERERLTAYPARPALASVARFQFFR